MVHNFIIKETRIITVTVRTDDKDINEALEYVKDEYFDGNFDEELNKQIATDYEIEPFYAYTDEGDINLSI